MRSYFHFQVDLADDIKTHQGIRDRLKSLFNSDAKFHFVYFCLRKDPQENIRELKRDSPLETQQVPIASETLKAALEKFCTPFAS